MDVGLVKASILLVPTRIVDAAEILIEEGQTIMAVTQRRVSPRRLPAGVTSLVEAVV
jgi:hypothetical protein